MRDQSHMQHALTLAARGIGRVAPNPAVGCVIVKDGRVVGRGWTQPGGRPHAETVALKRAGAAARGATAYVTLEPCAHLGQTPPCADALIKAGVARVVAAVEDPDPRVKGGGFKMLRDAGIEVVTGVLEKDAVHLNQGFFLRIQEKRPLVTVKLARSADHMTARRSADKWITGEEARRFGHLLRAQNDAILIGIGTALADDPMLDCRLPGLEDRSPMRVVLDTHLRLPESAKLVQTAAKIPTLVFTASDGGAALRKHGVEIVHVARGGSVDRLAVLRELASRGVTRLLVEGGATIASAYLDIADRLEIFTAPLTLGKDGAGAWRDPPNFLRVSERALGPDVLVSYARNA
jgi:diaminohydroxyphosphoribosylaminopyrimidine deaminase/5-amino-6-(5-phosphoribosylamino)uracil reductase